MSDFEPHHTSAVPGNLGFTTSLGASAQGRYIISSQTQHTGLPEKRRKMSKPKVSPILKRAVSTPQMAGLEEQDPGGLSPSALDKRRNKLGYQRISIACGHCRRRKIRCVLAEQDDMGRCQNCIRLKKECVFYPVDSAGGTESRAQQKQGSGSKASSIISNSPSDRKPGILGDGEREFGRFPPLASNAPSDITSVSSGSGLGISTNTAMTTPEYGYDSRDGWHSGVYSHADSAHSDGPAAPSWRVQDSPRIGEFTAFPTSDGQPGMYPGYQYPREYGMQPPMRSISYGNIEPSIGQFQTPATTNGVEFSRSGSASHFTMPPPEPSHAPTTTSMLDPAIAPVVSEAMPQYGMYSPQWHYGYQQSHHPVGMEYPRHDSVSMQWYPPQLAQGMEEQARHPQEHPQWQHHQQQSLMPPPGSGYSKGHSPG